MACTRSCALFLGMVLLCGGCSAASSDASSTAPAAPAAGTTASSAPVFAPAGSNSSVEARLQTAARNLVGRASRTVVPSKAKPSVTKTKGGVTVRYIKIDPTQVKTGLRPGSKANTYVGSVDYQEHEMMCTGATKEKALNGGSCTELLTRDVRELIRYDGKKWLY